MGTKEQINQTLAVFSSIIKKSLDPNFKIPRGGETVRVLEKWVGAMASLYGTLGQERIVEYCVCQAYSLSKMDDEYLKTRWKATHSFSSDGKAMSRYQGTSKQIKYYEDRWLAANGLTRQALIDAIKDKSNHPLYNMIYPEHEEGTKARQHSTDVGYYICGTSTLLYTPFSHVCSVCSKSSSCIERTLHLYPELYRIRMEAWGNKNKTNKE